MKRLKGIKGNGISEINQKEKKTHIRPNYHGRSDFPRLPYFIEQLEYDTEHDTVIHEPGTQLDATPLYGFGPTSRSPHHLQGYFSNLLLNKISL